MGKHVICRLEELPPGSSRRVDIEGREIAVFNDEGRLAALGNRCPHEGAELCHGLIRQFFAAEGAGEYEGTGKRMLRCPWHGWEFDLSTGQSYVDPARVRVRAFDVDVAPGEGLSEGPYKIDVYQIATEEDYVVLTI
ncbi:Rieske 2Fe-2S domain-containing protein [Rhodobacterales bacterium HKCCE4037]|nr:Rieske 2Fe-2S domain-containing protein [Rhodobacterales bacterium HKCCE4037]